MDDGWKMQGNVGGKRSDASDWVALLKGIDLYVVICWIFHSCIFQFVSVFM